MPLDETQIQIHQLAVQIADDAARTDIETKCPSFTFDGREPVTVEEIRAAWYDISMVDADMIRTVQVAINYLTLRGRIIHHPSKKNWMRMAT